MEEKIDQTNTKVTAEYNYTESFGFQWNRFEKTQIDKEKESIIQSQQRFLAVTEWDKEDLKNKKILEVGSGAGRFTRAALEVTQAEIYSVDYSSAVEANKRNNGSNPRVHIEKASVYELPFAKQSFDKVFCFGMLQHTPDPKKTIECLIDMVKPGGELVLDFYPLNGWYTKVHAKYIVRPFTKRLDHNRLLKWIQRNISILITLYKGLYAIGLGFLTRFIPIVDIYKVLPPGLSKEEEKEWAILDTFDMLSPQYDKPQKLADVLKWVSTSGLEIVFAGQISYQKNHVVTAIKAKRQCVE